MNGKTVIYPGSFDPFTNGHLNIIARAAGIFEKIIISVGHNISKKTTLSTEERVSLIAEVTKDYPNIEVESFEGLLVDYIRKKETNTVLRGMRCHSDFEYELQMATANKLMNEEVGNAVYGDRKPILSHKFIPHKGNNFPGRFRRGFRAGGS